MPRTPRDAGRLTGNYVPLNGQHSIVALADVQHTVMSVTQLVDVGLTASGVRKRAAAGHLHRVHKSVYSIAPKHLLSLKGRYMAAVLACGPGAVLSHRSAAHLHGLRPTERTNIDVTVPNRTTHKHEGIDLHRSITLIDTDITEVDGIPCTTIARTLLDLNDVISKRGVERAIEQGETMEVIDGDALKDQLTRRPRRPAARRFAAVLANLYPDAKPTESDLEEGLVALCRAAGLPEPERQVWIVPFEGESAVRADFLWRRQRLIVETDGFKGHRTRHRFEADRRKDQLLTLAGWTVIRITGRQLREEPQRLVATIAELLRRA